MLDRRSFIIASAALALPFGAPFAATFPSKPIRFVVSVSPGSATDGMARYVAERLNSTMGGSAVVENMPGAGVLIATEHVSRAPADGYTLLFTYSAHYMMQWASQTSIDAVRDFEPVARMTKTALVLITKGDSPYHTVADVVASAKRKPGSLSYATSGVGTSGHTAGALFAQMAGIELTHVPYKSSNQVVVDTASGHVELGFGGVAASLPLAKAGRIRILAVTTAERTQSLPDTPTIAESGFPGYENESWNMVFAPRGTPQAVIDKLSAAFIEIGSTQEFKEFAKNGGYDAAPLGAHELKALAPSELEKWKKMVELTVTKKS